MIDLHLHTKYSDGTWTLEELLRKAQEAKADIISITDHDTVDAYKALKDTDYKKIYNGEIIVGAEFNTVFEKYKFELLGYDFNINEIEPWINKSYTKDVDLNKEFAVLVDSCKKNNIRIDNNLYYETKMGWPIDIVFNSVIKYPENKKYFSEKEWNNSGTFFRSATCNVDFPLYMDFSYLYPNAKDVARAIRNAGGKVFLAHLFFYPLKDHISFLDMLREANILDGVEVYYPIYTPEQIKTLEEYCKKYNLYMSAGTDCHGARNPERNVGTGFGDMNVSKNILSKWH